jgi:hypothetical protein
MHDFPTEPAMLRISDPGANLTLKELPSLESFCSVASKYIPDDVTSAIRTHEYSPSSSK